MKSNLLGPFSKPQKGILENLLKGSVLVCSSKKSGKDNVETKLSETLKNDLLNIFREERIRRGED